MDHWIQAQAEIQAEQSVPDATEAGADKPKRRPAKVAAAKASRAEASTAAAKAAPRKSKPVKTCGRATKRV
jgi:hypothetical protein